MSETDRNLAFAELVVKDLPDNIISYFDKLVSDKNLSKCLDKDLTGWLNEKGADRKHGYNLTTLVEYLISTTGKLTGLKEDRMRYLDARRNRRLYLVKTVGNAAKPGKIMKGSWNEYSKIMGSPIANVKRYGSAEEYYKDKVDEINEWSKKPSPDLIDFPFFWYISPVKRYRDYLTDLGFYVFDSLTQTYGDELPQSASVDSTLLRTPDIISGKGMFGAISSVEELEAEVKDDAVNTYNSHTISTEDGEITIKTIIDRVPGNYRDIDDKDALIDTLAEQGQIKLINNMLDSVDMELFTHIFSSFSVEDVSRGRKEFNMDDLTKLLYTEAKAERKAAVINHLDRLGKYKVEYTKRNQNGELVEAGEIDFFNIIYRVPSKDDGSELTINSSLKRMDGSQSSFLDELKGYRAEDIKVEIQPSLRIRDAMVSTMNSAIFEEMYKQIPTHKSKNMLIFLQSRRTMIYPETSLDMSVKFLSQNFRLEKQRRSRQIQHLIEMIEPLKEAGVIVKDYSFDKTTVHIDFLPFTDRELSAYHIEDKKDVAL